MTQTVLTATGFRRKRFDDFIAEAEALAKEIFGADINLDAKGPLGKFINNIAFARAEDHELAEAVYHSGNVETAEGVSLDYAVKRGGVTRRAADSATGTVTFTTTAGKVIPAGTILSTAAGVEFSTTAQVTATGTSVDAPVVASLTGPAGNVPPSTINVIKTAIAGVTAVTNAAGTAGGKDAETDAQLRERYNDSLSNGGKGTVDAIRAELLSIESVRDAFVVENNTSTVDGSGRPPNSFEATVLGGTAAEIGAAIFRSKAAGIRAYGTQTVSVNDSSGNPQTVGFTYANAADVYVNVTVTKNSSFPVNGADLVEYQVIQYIGGTDAAGQAYKGLGLGDDVILAKILSAILSNVIGIDDIAVTMKKGAGGSFAASNVVISTTEVPATDATKVVVTVV